MTKLANTNELKIYAETQLLFWQHALVQIKYPYNIWDSRGARLRSLQTVPCGETLLL